MVDENLTPDSADSSDDKPFDAKRAFEELLSRQQRQEELQREFVGKVNGELKRHRLAAKDPGEATSMPQDPPAQPGDLESLVHAVVCASELERSLPEELKTALAPFLKGKSPRERAVLLETATLARSQSTPSPVPTKTLLGQGRAPGNPNQPSVTHPEYMDEFLALKPEQLRALNQDPTFDPGSLKRRASYRKL